MKYQLKDYEHVIRDVLESGGEFQIYPRGTSMLPLLWQDRDWVTLVKPVEPPRIRDIILYQRTDGSYVLHRILKREKDGYVLCGDNQAWLETGIQAEQIIGVVNALGINGKRYPKDSVRMQVYERIWCFMPLRKLYFRVLGHRYLKRKRKED